MASYVSTKTVGPFETEETEHSLLPTRKRTSPSTLEVSPKVKFPTGGLRGPVWRSEIPASKADS